LYEIAEESLGTRVRCPHCQAEIVASENGAGPATPNVFERRQTREKPQGHKRVKPWLFLLTAPLTYAVLFFALAVIGLRFYALPTPLVVWGPVPVAMAVSAWLFLKFATFGGAVVPLWSLCVALLCGVATTTIPSLVLASHIRTTVSNSLAQQINVELSRPHLPNGLVHCTGVVVREKEADGSWGVLVLLSDGSQNTLSASVNLATANLNHDAAFLALRARFVRQILGEALGTCLMEYPLFAEHVSEVVRVEEVGKPGTYRFVLTGASNVVFTAAARTDESGESCVLEEESALRAVAIPKATALWQRFDPRSRAVCVDVRLGSSIDKHRRHATALLGGDHSVPIVLFLSSGAETDVEVYFQFNESAVMAINEVVTFLEQGNHSRCVNVDRKCMLRTGEYDLRAILADGDPLWVLVRGDEYDLSVIPERQALLLDPGKRRLEDGWSMLVPKRYTIKKKGEFTTTAESRQDGVRITLETKQMSAFARFVLRDHAESIRDGWTRKYPGVDTGSLTEWTTDSGIQGYKYVARTDTAIRISYFFAEESRLAVVMVESKDATSALVDLADDVARSLRFKDAVSANARKDG